MNYGQRINLIALLFCFFPVCLGLCLLDYQTLSRRLYADESWRIAVTVDFGEDQGGAFGSLWQAVDAEGMALAGAGFLSTYNTQDRSDRSLLQVYFRTRQPADSQSPAWTTQLLPRPSTDAGTYLYGSQGNLYSYGRSGLDGALRVWNASENNWQLAPQTHPLSVEVAGKLLSVFPRQVTYADQVLMDLTDQQGQLAEWFYANGWLIVRRYSNEPDNVSNELLAFPWTPGSTNQLQLADAITVPLSRPGEFIYAFGQTAEDGHGPGILAASNLGSILRWTGAEWQSVRQPDGRSFQVYSTIRYQENLLLGHYPTGQLLNLEGLNLRQLAGWPPVMPGVRDQAREAQSTAIYGGDLIVGVWPWGELWRLDEPTQQWQLLGRLFSHPEPNDQWVHPYEEETLQMDPVLNRWGQRVTSLVPWGDSLYISTSAKGPNPYEEKFDFLSDGKHLEYGAVHRWRLPGCLAVAIQWKSQPTQLEFVFTQQSIHVYQDGQLIGSTQWEEDHPGRLEACAVHPGRGVYGPFGGKQLHLHQSGPCPAPSRWQGAYVHPHRHLSRDSSPDEQLAELATQLDQMQRMGLKQVMPFVTQSSGVANFNSQLLSPHFTQSDPIAIMADQCHQRGLSLVPVIPVVISGGDSPRGILQEHPEWALRNPDGNPMGYLSPGNPQARDWMVDLVREVVRKYQPPAIVLDYLRYQNRPHLLDEDSQGRFEASLPPQISATEREAAFQRFREEELTKLVQEICSAARQERPGIRIGAYVWGAHVTQNHLIAQTWFEWVRKGYLDMIQVSGYCHYEKYGDRFLDVFRQRLADCVELNQRLPHPAELTFALGVKTSHGSVRDADDILAYQREAESLGVPGFAYFTWEYLQPFKSTLNIR